MNEELKNKLQELIEEEYTTKGWVCTANSAMAPALWSDIDYYIDKLNKSQYEQATDVYLNQDDIDTFIEERINACIQRNISLL